MRLDERDVSRVRAVEDPAVVPGDLGAAAAYLPSHDVFDVHGVGGTVPRVEDIDRLGSVRRVAGVAAARREGDGAAVAGGPQRSGYAVPLRSPVRKARRREERAVGVEDDEPAAVLE